jgi:hypothetical protein
MVEILQGGFATSRGSSDLTEVQGKISPVFPGDIKLRRGRTIDTSHKGRWIYTNIVYRGFVD